MDEKLSRSMPRNKTGIYASEIRNMLVPNTGDTQQKMGSGKQRSDLGFRKHSAFRVNLKPRQPLVSVNTKLMEQQRPNTKESNLNEFVIEDDSDRNSNTFNEAENYIDSLIANKHRFRPSTVLRRTKLGDDRSGLPSSRSSSSKSISLYNRNKNTILYPEITKSVSPVIINRKEIKGSKMDQFVSQRQKTQVTKENFDSEVKLKETSESDFLSPKTKTDITALSNGTNFYHSKSKIDLFKEIYGNLTNKERKNQVKTGFRTKRYLLEDMNLNEENTELLIKNLSEEEFVNLLKEYRKTHELNLNTVVPKNKNDNEKFNASSKSTAKIINLKGEFERCSTYSNIYTHSSNKFPLFGKKRQLNSNQNESFLINGSRLPDYFVNYLNNKILVRKSAKSYFEIMAKKSDFPNAHYFKEIGKTEVKNETDANQTLMEPSPSIQQDENVENQKFQQQLKILNIPTTAN
ncbi:hypothetical protein BpHYR1_018860 [Brachionus plicatilis]|uniref:Uncharacterized protein n=1 Tax=Brachionus plicatilis TaxID=10195 RepID=A0A3M7PM97_BRAPC|nr:hypothetical protein BpHYR1_018860 [Brachionus plicatilis]